MGKLIAINISEKRGTEKKEIQEAELVTDFGIAGDAHAGKWHRQVSLLSFEKIEDFKARGARIENGAFGENLIVSGFDFKTLPVGTRFQIGDALIEMTQIGKQCHSHCSIYQRMGECIMPKEGVFAVVLKGGTVKKGDEVTMIPANFYATVRDRNKAADTLTATVITGKNRGEKLCMMEESVRYEVPVPECIMICTNKIWMKRRKNQNPDQIFLMKNMPKKSGRRILQANTGSRSKSRRFSFIPSEAGQGW
mgnify:CR=1 FL=1